MSTLPSRQKKTLFLPITLIHLTSISFSSPCDTLSLISPGYNAVLINIIMCYLVRPIQLTFSWGWLSLCHRQRPRHFLKLELCWPNLWCHRWRSPHILWQDNTYHGLCYAFVEHWLEREIAQLVHHEGSIRRPIAPWANTLTTELHLAPITCGFCSLVFSIMGFRWVHIAGRSCCLDFEIVQKGMVSFPT